MEHDEVRLYMDCGEAERTTFHRRPEKLTFSHNSGIFVANAGSRGLHKFVVSEKLYIFAVVFIPCTHKDFCFVLFMRIKEKNKTKNKGLPV